MQQNKVGFAQAHVVEDRFEQRRIGIAQLKVPTTSDSAMNVNRKSEPAGFPGDVAKDVVLQAEVIGFRRDAPGDEFRVNARSILQRGRFKIEAAQISGLELDRDGPCFLLPLQRRSHYLRQVLLQSSWRGSNV